MYDPTLIRTVADLPGVQARLRPDEAAFGFEGRTMTFAEVEAASNRCANALLAAGVQPGERVAILSKNTDAFYPLWLGCAKARACLAPVNFRLAPPEIAFILRDSGARVLVVGQDFAEVAEAIVGQVPGLAQLVQVEAGHSRWPSFDAWTGAHDAVDPALPIEPSDDLIQLYTSGTTGLPKGVMLTHANYLALFEGATQSGWGDFEAGKTCLVAMPLFHVAGVNPGLLTLLHGARALILRDVDMVAMLELLPRERVAYGFLAPVLINMLLATPGVEAADFSALERVFYGASPISEDVLLRAKARLGASFTQLYGLTETVGGGTYLAPEAHDPALGKLRACGVPWPNFEVRIITPGGITAGTGEVGEIQLRSPAVMKGYWNRPDATAEAIDAEGWFKTGDAGFIDADGYVFIHDRVKDMIVTGGENVYPAEVENAIFGHPSVADCAVIGVPDDRWGEAVKAIVVLRPGAEGDATSIIAYARERIAGFKAPKSVDYCEVLPRNPSGKVLRRELRAPYWAGRDRQVS